MMQTCAKFACADTLRKYIEISLENLYVDIGGYRVNVNLMLYMYIGYKSWYV